MLTGIDVEKCERVWAMKMHTHPKETLRAGSDRVLVLIRQDEDG